MSNQLTGSRGPMVVRDLAGGLGTFARGTLVFPATVNVADPVGLTDNEVAQLSVDSAGRLRVLASPASGAVFPVTPSVLADSLLVTGRAVAPAAGAAIATIVAPAAGTYDIELRVNYDAGAPAAAEINNFEFREGAAVVGSIIASPVLHTNVASKVRLRRVLDGVTNISVNATGAGTAAVGYSAEISAIRIA